MERQRDEARELIDAIEREAHGHSEYNPVSKKHRVPLGYLNIIALIEKHRALLTPKPTP